MDVKTAFLNAEVDEKIFMKQKEGCINRQAEPVCKLLKALHGPTQA